MKKQTLESYKLAFPDIVKTIGDYLKNIVSKESVEILSTSTGSIATLLKVFSTPIINKIYKDISDNQLKQFGFETYLKTAIEFSNTCLTNILEDHEITFDSKLDNELVGKTLPSIIEDQINLTKVNLAILFSPKYHPAVEFIKNVYVGVLTEQNFGNDIPNLFLKCFNLGISDRIKEAFGDSYEKHLIEVRADHLNERSIELLTELIKISRIGFDEKEKIDYVETYGKWVEIHDLEKRRAFSSDEEQLKQESKLAKVKDLISLYFDNDVDRTIEKVLFLVADFGKGKSVFLKHFASELATNYISNADGYFPIYFNLRDFNIYQSDSKHGVIYDYVETRYGIKLDDQYFKTKKYIFLVDSLDESGELVKAKIEKVISSVKRIQNIDKEICRHNRIVITTRPFDDGLKNQLFSHHPFLITNKEKKQQACYLALYGFKKIQLNQWLSDLLRNNSSFMNNSKGVYSVKIIEELKKHRVFDIHKMLSSESTLSYEELKRPIFGYMIYQLLINDYDFLTVGKIGVYLSFINLLSKEAKYIHDKNYSFSLLEQFESRNILHIISSLWVYQRSSGNQGSLKKADICRAVEVDYIDSIDDKVLDKFKGDGINEISFLSHSYFGENDNVLHFQHQSFAEILLAEYYLKILIKFSLDRIPNINAARKKLFVGNPSHQTLEFFKALLQIFKDTCSSDFNLEILEKRKLLFPFIASIATEKYNKELSSDDLFYNWFNRFEWNKTISEPPPELLENWFFNEEKLKGIVNFCTEIIEDESYQLLLSRSNTETALFNNELTKLKSEDFNIRNIDKLLCSFAGNILVNDITKRVFFMQNISESSTREMIDTMLRGSSNTLSIFRIECLKGIKLNGNGFLNFEALDLTLTDFSYSSFSNIHFKGAKLYSVNFSYSVFENSDFSQANFLLTNFEFCRFLGAAQFALSIIGQGIFFPYELAHKIHEVNLRKINMKDRSQYGINFFGIYACYGEYKTVLNKDVSSDFRMFYSFKHIIKFFVEESKILTYQKVIDSFNIKETTVAKKQLFKEKLLDYLKN